MRRDKDEIVLTSVSAKGSHGTAARPVAEDVLDQNVVGGALDGHTLVLVADFDIVDPDVGAPDTDAVQTTSVSTVDDHVVDLSVRAGIHGEMELGS